MNKIFSRYLPIVVIGLSFCGEAGAVPVTYTAETYLANAEARAVETEFYTIIAYDADNPTSSSSPPLSAHAEIPIVPDHAGFSAMGDALSQSGHLEMSAASESLSDGLNVFGYAHAGFIGEFTAATAETFFAYDMAYDLIATGDNPFSGFSHSWSLWDVTTSTPGLIDNGSETFTITSGSISDTTSDEILLSTTIGNDYRFYFDSGPFLDAQVYGIGASTAALTADYGLYTESIRAPEPSMLLLLGSGLAGLGLLRKRFKA